MSDKNETESDAPKALPQSKTTRLRVETPWCTGFTFPGEDGDTLVIDRKGVEVPSEEASRLIDTAAQHGVKIVEVSE